MLLVSNAAVAEPGAAGLTDTAAFEGFADFTGFAGFADFKVFAELAVFAEFAAVILEVFTASETVEEVFAESLASGTVFGRSVALMAILLVAITASVAALLL
ncbi:MAG TPA: hypothetical protein DCG57_14350 [Candidatus Riflebacteria bacterium]|nr:hypothetical protein [Candidatus Riflebacteria bacterium]